MKKKYTAPVVSTFATEGTALLAGSGDENPDKYKVTVDGNEGSSGIWEKNPDEIDANENTFGWE